MNYKEIYLEAVGRLREAGIAEAELDARLLLEFICKTDRNTLLVHPEKAVSEEQYEDYVNLIERRMEHNPIQHLIGKQGFMGLEFYVNPDVLIPRQDTEILVEEIMPHVHDGMKIWDVCTGSGCILISLLQYSNDCAGLGTDISQNALEVAVKNARDILERKGMCVLEEEGEPTAGVVRFCCGDLLDAFNGTEKFDIIVSNPPYIPTGVIATLEPEVAKKEPLLALDGKEDGLFFYRKLTASAGKYLTRGGKLFFEIGYDQGEAVSGLLADAGFVEIEVKKDYAGLDRVVFGTWLEEKDV